MAKQAQKTIRAAASLRSAGPDKARAELLHALMKDMRVQFNDLSLLNQALTHPTFFEGDKAKQCRHNQRMEFLGDAVLDMVVGDYLYQCYPEQQEGGLTKMRSAVVCEAALAKAARGLGLGNYLLLGRGGENSGDRKRQSILADTFEAVVGAIYLEKGVYVARRFILRQLKEQLEELKEGHYDDYKSLLQEYVQSRGQSNVSYRVIKEWGPDHDKRFLVGVFYKRWQLAEGEGSSKKEGELKAAAAAWDSRNTWKRYFKEARHD